MLSIIASGIGGVGIFFAGMYLLAENLKKLTGSRFRRTVAAWTKSLWAGILWGFAAGAVMQSTSAITFIIVSMLGSGLLTVESGLAILVGANVGATIVVVIATLVSVWKLMPARGRLRSMLALDAWLAHKDFLQGWRTRVLARRIQAAAGPGCAGCAANAANRPPAPRR